VIVRDEDVVLVREHGEEERLLQEQCARPAVSESGFALAHRVRSGVAVTVHWGDTIHGTVTLDGASQVQLRMDEGILLFWDDCGRITALDEATGRTLHDLTL
jgi:hypothetical protein